jgi:hypothetical protein
VSEPPHPSGGRRAAAVAAALYLAVAVWTLRSVLPEPATSLPFPPGAERIGERFLAGGDHHFIAAQVYGTARRLVTAPGRLFDSGFCFPVRNAVTLGEHMFGNGLLAVVPYLLGATPVLAMNVVSLVTTWLAGLAMYALVHYWTRSPGAAFVAGLLFAFHPSRSGSPGNPFVHGNQWTPLALLFAHRLFAEGRWRDAAGLVLFVGLQLLESFYQVIAFALLGGTYGLYLLARYRRRLVALAPKLAACAVASAVLAALVLGPYLETQRTWGVLSRGFVFLLFPSAFLPGGSASPGLVALALAALGLLDRLRGPRAARGYDPRLVYLLGGFLVFWTVVRALPVPLLEVRIPSLAAFLTAVVPGIDAGRALPAARYAVFLVAAFLAGYGVLALTQRRGTVARGALTGALAAAALLDAFWPPLARASFGRVPQLRAHRVEPAAELLALYASQGDGAVLDIPLRGRKLPLASGEYVFLAAYHERPVGACYNSYAIPLVKDIEALAARVPERRAVEALHALGFRTLVVHRERMPPELGGVLEAAFAAASGHLVPVGRADRHQVFRMRTDGPVSIGFGALAPAAAPAEVADARPAETTLVFRFRNESAESYLHPDPIEPTPLLVRWQASGGEVVQESRIRGLLPVALAREEEAERSFAVAVPAAPDIYEVSLAPERAPDLVIARRTVRVVASR